MKKSIFTVIVYILYNSYSYSQESNTILRQDTVDKNSCGPCATINWLWSGTDNMKSSSKKLGTTQAEQAKTFISKFCSKDSLFSKKSNKRKRFANGMQPSDLVEAINDLSKYTAGKVPVVEGTQLLRKEKESKQDHTHRIYTQIKASIDSGVPVIAHIRTFGFYHDDKANRYLNRFLVGHFIVVEEIQKDFNAENLAFTFHFTDSGSGTRGFAMAHVAPYDFYAKVWEGKQKYGKESQPYWHNNYPLLQVKSPSLGATLSGRRKQYHLSGNACLNFIICAKPASK